MAGRSVRVFSGKSLFVALAIGGSLAACSSSSSPTGRDSGGALDVASLGAGGTVDTGGVLGTGGATGTGGALVGGTDGGAGGIDANLADRPSDSSGLGGRASGGAAGGTTRTGTGGAGSGGRLGSGGQGTAVDGGSTASGGAGGKSGSGGAVDGGSTASGGAGGKSGSGGAVGSGGTASGGAGGKSGSGGAVGSGGSTQAGVDGGVASGLWVIGSHPDYQWADVPAEKVPWSHLTHLVLEFLEPTGSNGSYALDVTGYGPATMSAWKTAAQGYLTAAHAAGVKVICSLGGEGLGGAVFTEATATVAKSDALAAIIATTLIDMGFDGVDIDWEETYDAAGAARLLHSLRAAWPSAIITTSVGPAYGDDQVAINRTLAAVKDDVDAYMIMLYIPGDQTWTWWVVPVPLTPLHGTPTPWGEVQAYSADRELEVWTSVGVPASKLILGVGGFGLAWVDSNRDKIAPVAPYANYDALSADPTCSASPWTCAAPADTEKSPSSCSDNRVTQKWVDQAVAASNGALQLKTDTVGEVTYWAAPASDQLVTVPSPCGSGTVDVGLIFYETPTSMTSKVSYCNGKGMRGMEFWTMGQMVDASGRYPILEAAKP
jgi:GH18 family chitinase